LAQAADCPTLLQGSLPKLRAKESIDLCQRFAGKPLVVVNTASFCGFARSSKALKPESALQGPGAGSARRAVQ
jgi:glutathione peroxidase